jgi:hypothetical protein
MLFEILGDLCIIILVLAIAYGKARNHEKEGS